MLGGWKCVLCAGGGGGDHSTVPEGWPFSPEYGHLREPMDGKASRSKTKL